MPLSFKDRCLNVNMMLSRRADILASAEYEQVVALKMISYAQPKHHEKDTQDNQVYSKQ